MAIDWRKKVIFVQYNTKKKWIIKYIGPFSLKKRRKKFTELFEKGKYQTESIIFFRKINFWKYKTWRYNLEYQQ
jgi:hypothetical protein